jgi:hypothetical protein
MTPLNNYAPRFSIVADVFLPNASTRSEGTGEYVYSNLCSPNITFQRRAA